MSILPSYAATTFFSFFPPLHSAVRLAACGLRKIYGLSDLGAGISIHHEHSIHWTMLTMLFVALVVNGR